MSDLINRQDVIKRAHLPTIEDAGYEVIRLDYVLSLTPAQPEREKGKWILGGYEDMYYICDQCGHKETEYYSVPKANFCKVCGADMRGERNEID